MNDLISRYAAIDAICQDWCGTSNADCKNPFNPATDDYYFCDGCGDVELIKALSSAQSETIQCKDCRYRDPEDKKCDCGHDIIWQLPRADSWYCANGELKK